MGDRASVTTHRYRYSSTGPAIRRIGVAESPCNVLSCHGETPNRHVWVTHPTFGPPMLGLISGPVPTPVPSRVCAREFDDGPSSLVMPSQDLELAERVHRWLLVDGHQAFLDRSMADGILPGDEWERRLREWLRWADGVVCLITAAFVRSTWCTSGVAVARSRPAATSDGRVRRGTAVPDVTAARGPRQGRSEYARQSCRRCSRSTPSVGRASRTTAPPSRSARTSTGHPSAARRTGMRSPGGYAPRPSQLIRGCCRWSGLRLRQLVAGVRRSAARPANAAALSRGQRSRPAVARAVARCGPQRS
jgi:TIR domain